MCLKPRNTKLNKLNSKDKPHGHLGSNQTLQGDPTRLKKLNTGIPSISQALRGDPPYAKRFESIDQFAEPDFLNKPLTIDEQFQHPLWQKRCRELMQSREQVCQCCGDADAHLQIFPLNDKPKGCLWEEDEDGLKTVCDSCRELLKDKHAKLARIIAFNILAGKLDPFDLIPSL